MNATAWEISVWKHHLPELGELGEGWEQGRAYENGGKRAVKRFKTLAEAQEMYAKVKGVGIPVLRNWLT